jgi:hypothetical protein
MGNPLLNSLLARWLVIENVTVPAVDCDVCTLSVQRSAVRERWHRYKCCTFQPFVSNFAAGAMLEAGLEPLRLDPAKAVLRPLGVLPIKAFRELYSQTSEDTRGEDHLCSYFDRERRHCGIWRFRPGECSTHFCNTGERTATLEALSHQAFTLETAVAQMALVHLGFSGEEVACEVDGLNAPPGDMRGLDARIAAEIYRASWEWARGLDREEVFSWLDSRPGEG